MRMICEFFQVLFSQKYLTSAAKSWNTRKIASESLQKTRTKFYEVAVAEYVWVDLKL